MVPGSGILSQASMEAGQGVMGLELIFRLGWGLGWGLSQLFFEAGDRLMITMVAN